MRRGKSGPQRAMRIVTAASAARLRMGDRKAGGGKKKPAGERGMSYGRESTDRVVRARR